MSPSPPGTPVDAPASDGEQAPPIGRSWRNLYALVLGGLLVVVTLLALLSRVYS